MLGFLETSLWAEWERVFSMCVIYHLQCNWHQSTALLGGEGHDYGYLCLGRRLRGAAHVQSTWNFERVRELQVKQHKHINLLCGSDRAAPSRKFSPLWLLYTYHKPPDISGWPTAQSKLCMPGAASCQEIPGSGMPSPLTLLKEIWTCGNLCRGQACAPTVQ